MANLRYSDLRTRPSSNTTIDATTWVPWRLETSKHSIRSGGVSRPSASCISCMAWLRVLRSLARLVLCSARASVAFLVTVSSSALLSPRCGTRRLTPPRPRAGYPGVAQVEALDGGLELGLDQTDHVAVRAVGQHDGLLLQRALQGLQVIAQPRRPLELLGLRRLVHRGLESLRELAGLAGDEVAEFLGELPVIVRADPAHAGCRAFADVAEQARAADLAGPLEDAR